MPSPADPVAVAIGPLSVRWYAVLIMLGIVAAVILLRWLARQWGLDPEFPLDAAPWVVLAAIVGARLYYLLLKWDYYLDNPAEAFNVRLGGLTVHGAIAGGAFALFLYSRVRGERFVTWGDLTIASVPVGQAIGRWGNWANQEAFGTPSNLPWAVEIEPAKRPADYMFFDTFHPTFLYESILDLAIAAILVWIVLRMRYDWRWREGDAIWTYAVLYGSVRFAIESMRTDSLYIGPFPAAYWISWGLIGGGIAMLLLRRTIWPARHAADTYDELAQRRSASFERVEGDEGAHS
jgi:phosphatidylglycerol---prolipoprotein diacylglyceryl transferase